MRRRICVAAARFRNARRALHRREVERLEADLALTQLHLPQVSSAHLDADAVDQLATRLLDLVP